MTDDPRFVDLNDFPLIADEAWYLQQMTNGNGGIRVTETVYGQSSWTPQDLTELEELPPVEPTLGGIGIVYPGKRHVFSGPQESAKTLAAYVIGLEVVRRGERVILVDFEMGPWDARTRLRELGASQEEVARFAYVEPSEAPTDAETAVLVALEPGLVILDASAGAFAVSGLDDNRRAEVELWARRWIEPFRKAKIATIVLDHVVKNAETRGNYAIGSERKVGGADVHLGFTVVTPIRRGAKGVYRVVTHKDRGGYLKRGRLADFELDSDAETHRISWTFNLSPAVDEEHPFRPTGYMQRVSEYLETQIDSVSGRTIVKDVTGKDNRIRESLEILVAEGFVDQTETPNGSEYVTISRYREADDKGAAQVRPGAAQNGSGGGAALRPSPEGGRTWPQPPTGSGRTPDIPYD